MRCDAMRCDAMRCDAMQTRVALHQTNFTHIPPFFLSLFLLVCSLLGRSIGAKSLFVVFGLFRRLKMYFRISNFLFLSSFSLSLFLFLSLSLSFSSLYFLFV
ncbi:hypothetical protein BO71DRAFT_174116 [Aspergillus ellipticus CBS 707.79]|uniref:Transmembrane protein n=1 Tax=Aspergillus ellipticus CBS 707.79 TaxID=1448320 RepID=A0A319DGI1_9EURO|nr:hypothetical protein BO71DRAFT_174116 [Aspergillus ellipticus CBS 707.79]